MRRLLADRLVLASAVIVVLMSALFAVLRVTGNHAHAAQRGFRAKVTVTVAVTSTEPGSTGMVAL
jgi:hypothetical protein